MKDVEITDVTADSRTAGKGSLYIAIRGGSTDGELHIADAAARGAVAAVSERTPEAPPIQIIETENARELGCRITAAWYGGDETGRPHKTKLIAVTGTNGKTTVSYMLASMMKAAGYSVGIVGTVGAHMDGVDYDEGECASMTTPSADVFYRILWDMIRRGADYIVFEASSHGIAQHRLSGLPLLGCGLKAAIFTNLSPEHLDYHASMEEYFGVKARLFSDFAPEKKIINATGEYGARLLAMYPDAAAVDARGVGDAAFPSSIAERGFDGVDFIYNSPSGSFPVRVGAPGLYSVEDAILALTCAIEIGVDRDSAVAALGDFHGVRGRMERVGGAGNAQPTVIIDFAHTPAALEGLLRSVRDIAERRRITVVFGCGGDRDKTKRPVMGKIAAEGADFVIVTSDNRRTERAADIIADIIAGIPRGCEYAVIPNRTEAIEFAIWNADDGDIVILAGKGHESYDDADGVKRPYDERKIAADAQRLRRILRGARR